MDKHLRYPIRSRKSTPIEAFALKFKRMPFKCNICGKISTLIIGNDNLRENCLCNSCNSFNRQRQIAYILCKAIGNPKVRSLRDVASLEQLAIYNTETWGVLHNYLSKVKGYVCSEYFGPEYKSGEMINEKLHQDLMAPSFPDNSFDYIISTDVFEHIPQPYTAHQQIFRILKPGGRHIFTVPFYQEEFLDQNRASLDENGQIIHHTKPWYHIDPLRSEGILCFNVFSIEMLVQLARIGFRTNLYHLYRPVNGILGNNGIVFEAIKDSSQYSTYLP